MGIIGNAVQQNKPVTQQQAGRFVQPAPQQTQQAPPQQQQAPAPQQTQGGRPAPRFSTARARGNRGLYLKPVDASTAGQYVLRINRVGQNWANPQAKYDDGRPQPDASSAPSFGGKDNFFAEVEVVASNVAQCPPGFAASWGTNTKYLDSYFGDIKGFLESVFNTDDVDENDWELSYSTREQYERAHGQGSWPSKADGSPMDEQPCAGMLVNCTVREKPTRDQKGTFTVHIFSTNETQHPPQAQG